MPEEITITTQLIPHNQPTKAQNDLAKKGQKIKRSLEILYANPWGAMLLNLLPINPIIDKDVYTIYSRFSELGLHDNLKQCLALLNKPIDFSKDLLDKILDANSILNEQISRLKNIADKRQLNITDHEWLALFVKETKLSNQMRAGFNHIFSINLTDDNKKYLNDLADNYKSIEKLYAFLNELIVSKKLPKEIPAEFKTLSANSILKPEEFNLLVTIFNKREITLSANEIKQLKTIVSRPFLNEEECNDLKRIANSPNYALNDRRWLQSLGQRKSFFELISIAENYSLQDENIQLIERFITSHPTLDSEQKELLRKVEREQQLDVAFHPAFKGIANSHFLSSDVKRQLNEIIKQSTRFKLEPDFSLEDFFEDKLIDLFLNKIQPKYQGVPETKKLNKLELQRIEDIIQDEGIAQAYPELAAILNKIKNKKELNTRDNKQLEAIIANPNLSAAERDLLKTMPSKRPLTKREKDHLVAIATNSHLDDIIGNRLRDIAASSIIDEEDYKFLQLLSYKPNISFDYIVKLRDIQKNEQLTPSAGKYLSKLKKAINRIADRFGFTRIIWSEEHQHYVELIIDKNLREDMAKDVTTKAAETQSIEEKLELERQQRRLTLEAPLVNELHDKHTLQTKIKQRRYKQLINRLSKPFTILFTVGSGIFAFITVLAAFSINPPLAIVLACVAGIGAAIYKSKLNKNSLSEFIINLFIKGNYWRNLTWTQRTLLVALNIVSLIGAIGLGLLFFALATTQLTLLFTVLGIVCPPLVPLGIGIGLSILFVPVIILINYVTFVNLSYELIKHNSIGKFFKFLYKNFIQEVIEAENHSARLAQIGKCIALIVFGLGLISLAAAAAVIVGILLQEATEPLLHMLTHLTHMGEGLLVTIETTLLAISVSLSSINFLTTSEHFAHFSYQLANTTKRVLSTLLQPIQSLLSFKTSINSPNAELKPAADSKSYTERVKHFFTITLPNKTKHFFTETIPSARKELKSNPWRLSGIARFVEYCISSASMIINSASEAALASAVGATAEVIEAGIAIIASKNIATTASQLTSGQPKTKQIEKGHSRTAALDVTALDNIAATKNTSAPSKVSASNDDTSALKQHSVFSSAYRKSKRMSYASDQNNNTFIKGYSTSINR